jgi:hypothetical protein
MATMQKLWTTLGSCQYCMRTAFLYSLVAWSVATGMSLLSVNSNILYTAAVCALALTILWFVHILIFALKHSADKGTRILREDSDNGAIRFLSRRDAIPVFARVLMLAAAGTTVLPSMALACSVTCGNKSCDNGGCPAGQTCYAECQNGVPYCYCRG